MSIAAASILAKTFRDDYMLKIHPDFPEYCWDQNKGYPTEKHRKAISRYGITEHHRKSFRLTNNQLSLDL
jgi:ribonuclease HII